MKLAKKVIFLVRDPNGFGPSLFESLLPNPNSNLTKSLSTSFELSLEKYGVTDQKASGDMVHFLDPHGSPQVSILLIPNYATPIAACAVREVLSLCTAEETSDQSLMIVPSVMNALKLNRERSGSLSSEQEVTLYGAEIGGTTDLSQAMVSGIPTIPSSVRANSEPLACLLQMIRVLHLPTVLLIASGGHSLNRSIDHELEALVRVGEFLGKHIGLSFSKERIQHKQVERSKVPQEPWRALYM